MRTILKPYLLFLLGWPSGTGGGECVDYIGVSQDKIGLVIGKGGDTIKSINQVRKNNWRRGGL